MHAIILSIGDELVLGQINDTNATWLSARLAESGVMTVWRQTVSDDCAAISKALLAASAEADLILVTGGLGPTPDDLTRNALADLLNAPLLLNEAARLQIEAFFKTRGRPMPESNLTQAFVPQGAISLPNPAGTAPGIQALFNKTHIFLMPGVPHEMRVLFDLYVLPFLTKQPAHASRVILTEELHTFGLGESQVAETLGSLMQRDRNPLVGTTAADSIVTVRVRADFPDAQTAQNMLAETLQKAQACLGEAVLGNSSDSLPKSVASLLSKLNKRLVTAESCTGGLVGKMLTDIPGASKFYLGGWIVYDNSMKMQQLNVPSSLLQTFGAVSKPAALNLAEEALRLSGADYALSVTGIAGPAGGSPEKPVGTVWVALAERLQNKIISYAEICRCHGTREMVRDRAAKYALNLLRLRLLGKRAGYEK